jgi:hypothetical protein
LEAAGGHAARAKKSRRLLGGSCFGCSRRCLAATRAVRCRSCGALGMPGPSFGSPAAQAACTLRSTPAPSARPYGQHARPALVGAAPHICCQRLMNCLAPPRLLHCRRQLFEPFPDIASSSHPLHTGPAALARHAGACSSGRARPAVTLARRYCGCRHLLAFVPCRRRSRGRRCLASAGAPSLDLAARPPADRRIQRARRSRRQQAAASLRRRAAVHARGTPARRKGARSASGASVCTLNHTTQGGESTKAKAQGGSAPRPARPPKARLPAAAACLSRVSYEVPQPPRWG